jgi:hypothetical protein
MPWFRVRLKGAAVFSWTRKNPSDQRTRVALNEMGSVARRLIFWAVGLLCLAQCGQAADGDLGDACVALRDELRAIRSCQSSEQCGQVLVGTSCGCTRDLVATTNADTGRFRELQTRVRMLLGDAGTIPAACASLGFGSVCDCPPAEGFACVEGVCSWSYTR